MQTRNKIVGDDSPNQSQLDAIRTTEYPLLIIAGPGSGKTFTLVERAFYLIAEKNVSPENILISSSTQKTTSEIATHFPNKLIKNIFFVKGDSK